MKQNQRTQPKVLQFQANYKKDQFSNQNWYQTPYFTQFEVIETGKYNTRVNAYKLVGLAKINNSLYNQYKMLQPPNLYFPTNQKKLFNGIDYQQLHQDQQNDYIKGKVNALLIAFLVHAWKSLNRKYKLTQFQINNQLFGKLSQKDNAYKHYLYLLQKTKQYLFKTQEEIMKSSQFSQPVYGYEIETRTKYKRIFYQTNLFKKLQIISRQQKFMRLTQIGKCKLWNIKIARDRSDYYIIINGFSSHQLKPKNMTTLKSLDYHIESANHDGVSKATKISKLKQFGGNILFQLRKYSKQVQNIPYIWVEPRNIIVNQQSRRYHLSPIPPLLYALGLSEEPMSIEMKITMLTPKGINLYKAPQQFQQNAKLDERTITWKFILLLDNFCRMKHLFSECLHQDDMRNSFPQFQKKLMQLHKTEKGSDITFIGVIMKQLPKFIKNLQWEFQSERPPIKQLEYFFAEQPIMKSQAEDFSQEQFQMLIFQRKQFKELKQYLKEENTNILQIHKDFLLYYISIVLWITLVRLNEIKPGEDYSQKRILEQQKYYKAKFEKLTTQKLQITYPNGGKEFLKKNERSFKHIKSLNLTNNKNHIIIYYNALQEAIQIYKDQKVQKNINIHQKRFFLTLQLLRKLNLKNHQHLEHVLLQKIKSMPQNIADNNLLILQKDINSLSD